LSYVFIVTLELQSAPYDVCCFRSISGCRPILLHNVDMVTLCLDSIQLICRFGVFLAGLPWDGNSRGDSHEDWDTWIPTGFSVRMRWAWAWDPIPTAALVLGKPRQFWGS